MTRLAHWAGLPLYGHGDQRAVTILLGADPNLVDLQNSGPLMYAAAQNYVICVRLLFEAGAIPDPTLFGLKMQRGNPLNYAARIASDPPIESCGAEKWTSLLHASRNDNVDFVVLLLDYGAEINATSTTAQTVLTTAITPNSHNVLRLLLDRWQGYSTFPRLKGLHLLEITAFYTDLETIKILTCVDHFSLSYDKGYATGDFASRLHDRSFK